MRHFLVRQLNERHVASFVVRVTWRRGALSLSDPNLELSWMTNIISRMD